MIIRNQSAAAQGLTLQLLTPEEACDLEYWVARLTDPELLRNAVAIALHRLPFFTVPAGAGRRGGQLDVINEPFAKLTAQALKRRQGFETVAACGPHVAWGEPLPAHPSAQERRQFYGLREQPRGRCDCVASRRTQGVRHNHWTLAVHLTATAK